MWFRGDYLEKSILDYIVSPQNHSKLHKSINKLYDNDGKKYDIVKGVPILLPKNTTAKWQRELIEVILWEYPNEIEKIYEELSNVKDYSEVYIKYIKRLLRDKQGIIATLEKYSQQNTEIWLPQSPKIITLNQKQNFNEFAKKKIGKKRTETKINATGNFVVYPHFSKAVNHSLPQSIVELGTGAGGGTASIALEMNKTTKLFTVDIDFECLGNAIGIRKYQKKYIVPICANFWYLPFANNSIDTVCTYNGLDESRENERTIFEISRILKDKGRFVVVSRKNAYMRQARVLDPFGFNENETIDILKRCRLYSDTNNLDFVCGQQGLKLSDKKEFIMNDDLTYVLAIYEK